MYIIDLGFTFDPFFKMACTFTMLLLSDNLHAYPLHELIKLSSVSAKLQSPPLSVLSFCSRDKVCFNQEVRFLMNSLCQIVT